MHRTTLWAFVLAWATWPAAAQDPPARLRVAVSILPQAYFVERVAGERVEVEVLVGPGQSPHTFEPTAKQIVRLSECAAYFRIGVDFERALVPRIEKMFRGLRIVDVRAGVPLRRMEPAEACAHDHDHAAHDHAPSQPSDDPYAGYDPHVWLSPQRVKTIAQTMCDTLCELDAAHAAEYRRNLAAFQAELDRVAAEIAAVLEPLKGQKVYVFHPAFGYFLDDFGLVQVPVEVAGKQPPARQLIRLIDAARSERVQVIFVQPQFSKKSAQTVAEAIGGAVVAIDPLARDYLANLRTLATEIRNGLETRKP